MVAAAPVTAGNADRIIARVQPEDQSVCSSSDLNNDWPHRTFRRWRSHFDNNPDIGAGPFFQFN
jgi:hypothetical protein